MSLLICVITVLARQPVFHSDYFSGLFLSVAIFMLNCTVLLEELVAFFLYLFKSRLIPTIFLVLGWRYQLECIQAGIYLLFYTLLGSLPLLVCVLFTYGSSGSLRLFLLQNTVLDRRMFHVCVFWIFG